VSVTYEVRDGIAWLTINRPETRNSLNKAVRDRLFEAVHTLNDDDTAEELWAPVYLSADEQEGMQAFAEKRPPAWKGM
jgi:enoyl-CoA hydratase/carnithine racemase